MLVQVVVWGILAKVVTLEVAPVVAHIAAPAPQPDSMPAEQSTCDDYRKTR
ncbi:hypothetical protein Sjap_022276 [Stephania japonica]|uniref:Uncharacterized protein n=1 Tax=Stephania japonica TaxID=461633 RepID=A0AAP0HSN5_9MAGN